MIDHWVPEEITVSLIERGDFGRSQMLFWGADEIDLDDLMTIELRDKSKMTNTDTEIQDQLSI